MITDYCLAQELEYDIIYLKKLEYIVNIMTCASFKERVMRGSAESSLFNQIKTVTVILTAENYWVSLIYNIQMACRLHINSTGLPQNEHSYVSETSTRS